MDDRTRALERRLEADPKDTNALQQLVQVHQRTGKRFDGKTINEWLQTLNTGLPYQQTQASLAFTRMGVLGYQAIPILIQKLNTELNAPNQSPSEKALDSFVWALGKIAPNSEQAFHITDLITQNDEVHDSLRLTAIRSLPRYNKSFAQRAFDTLEPFITLNDWEVRRASILAIGFLDVDPESVYKSLLKGLEDSIYDVQAAVIMAFSQLPKHPKAQKVLLEHLRDGDWEMRLLVARLCARQIPKPKSVITALLKALPKGDDDDMRALTRALTVNDIIPQNTVSKLAELLAKKPKNKTFASLSKAHLSHDTEARLAPR